LRKHRRDGPLLPSSLSLMLSFPFFFFSFLFSPWFLLMLRGVDGDKESRTRLLFSSPFSFFSLSLFSFLFPSLPPEKERVIDTSLAKILLPFFSFFPFSFLSSVRKKGQEAPFFSLFLFLFLPPFSRLLLPSTACCLSHGEARERKKSAEPPFVSPYPLSPFSFSLLFFFFFFFVRTVLAVSELPRGIKKCWAVLSFLEFFTFSFSSSLSFFSPGRRGLLDRVEEK